MKIRKATKKDFGIIAKILRIESSKKPYNEKYNNKKSLEEVKDFAKSELYLAEIEKEIVGFISAYIIPENKEKAYIRELWLKEKFQGQGIGKKLVNFIENKYKKSKVKLIRLVAKRNAGAFKFYKKLKYNEHQELVFMEKKMNDKFNEKNKKINLNKLSNFFTWFSLITLAIATILLWIIVGKTNTIILITSLVGVIFLINLSTLITNKIYKKEIFESVDLLKHRSNKFLTQSIFFFGVGLPLFIDSWRNNFSNMAQLYISIGLIFIGDIIYVCYLKRDKLIEKLTGEIK